MNLCNNFCFVPVVFSNNLLSGHCYEGLKRLCLAHTHQVGARFLFTALFFTFSLMQNWRGISTLLPVVLQTNICIQVYAILLQSQHHLVLINVLLCESQPCGLFSHTALFAPYTLVSEWYLCDQYVLSHRMCLFIYLFMW